MENNFDKFMYEKCCNLREKGDIEKAVKGVLGKQWIRTECTHRTVDLKYKSKNQNMMREICQSDR